MLLPSTVGSTIWLSGGGAVPGSVSSMIYSTALLAKLRAAALAQLLCHVTLLWSGAGLAVRTCWITFAEAGLLARRPVLRALDVSPRHLGLQGGKPAGPAAVLVQKLLASLACKLAAAMLR
jgi:hypothetical protein